MFASFRSALRKLPLTEDAFNFHLLRALYQIAWYKRAHLSEPALPSPLELKGAEQDTNSNSYTYITAKPDIKQSVHCKCENKCWRAARALKPRLPVLSVLMSG